RTLRPASPSARRTAPWNSSFGTVKDTLAWQGPSFSTVTCTGGGNGPRMEGAASWIGSLGLASDAERGKGGTLAHGGRAVHRPAARRALLAARAGLGEPARGPMDRRIRSVDRLEEALELATALEAYAAQATAEFRDDPLPEGTCRRFFERRFADRETLLLVA